MRAVLAIIGAARLTSSMVKLYDLAGDNPKLRFSPFCWRTKMALLHKGLAFETVPWRFTEKDVISRTGQGRVPVLVDGDEWIHDSWQIAIHLDRRYPDRPALMATEAERAAAFFLNSWCDLTLHPALRPLVFLDVFNAAAEKDRAYFRSSREKGVGRSLENFCADRGSAQTAFVQTLAPIELTLQNYAYLGGATANYSDYALLGSLQWGRCVSGTAFLPSDSATNRWFERMLDVHDACARNAPTVRDLAAA